MNGVYSLKNTNPAGNADLVFIYGSTGDLPVTGDWNGDGVDNIGTYRNGLYSSQICHATGKFLGPLYPSPRIAS